MKSILTIILVVLGMTITNAQGFMFFTPDEVRNEVKNDTCTIETGTTSDGTLWMSVSDEYYKWILFFEGDNPVVTEAQLICSSLEGFIASIKTIDTSDLFIRQGDGNWLIMRGSYAIQVRTKMLDYSNIPVFVYSYKTY